MQNEEGGKTGMAQWKRIKAKNYYKEHKDASISEVARECHVSNRTAAEARAELVLEGTLEAGRKTEEIQEELKQTADLMLEQEKPVRKPKMKGGLLTDEMMTKLAEENSALEDIVNLDDETIRKTLLSEVIKTALKPSNHPDTRLTATQVWVKLKDMARAADYGPGKPMTRADAIQRLKELLIAVGPEIALEAVTVAFNVKESTDGKAVVETGTPSGASENPSPANNAGEATQA